MTARPRPEKSSQKKSVSPRGKAPPDPVVSDGRFKRIFERSPIMVYMTDLHGTFLEINQAGAALLGYASREEVIGRVSAKTIYEDPRERFRFRDIMFRDGSVQEFATRIRRPKGDVRDIAITSTVRRDAKGQIAGYEGFVIDVTDRRQAEAALRESEEKYRTVVENSLAGIFIHQKGIMQYVNPRLVEMLGYDGPQEIIGQPFWMLVHPEDRAIVKDRGLRREKGQVHPARYEFRLIRKDGSTIWVDMQATRATYRGEPAVVGNFNDITASRRAGEEIRLLSRRLIEATEQEKKRLAADLHDEFGQTLTSIHFGLEALHAEAKDIPGLDRKQIDLLIQQVEGLADSIRRTTARLRPAILDHLGLVPTMEWYLQDFERRCPEIDIEFRVVGLKKRLEAETEVVLYRIFQECLTNIAKHSGATRVDVTLTHSHPQIILLVVDNGIGYEQAESGLPAWKGSQGIGLLSIRERVASLGGVIEMTSAPGRGTRMRIEIPAG